MRGLLLSLLLLGVLLLGACASPMAKEDINQGPREEVVQTTDALLETMLRQTSHSEPEVDLESEDSEDGDDADAEDHGDLKTKAFTILSNNNHLQDDRPPAFQINYKAIMEEAHKTKSKRLKKSMEAEAQGLAQDDMKRATMEKQAKAEVKRMAEKKVKEEKKFQARLAEEDVKAKKIEQKKQEMFQKNLKRRERADKARVIKAERSAKHKIKEERRMKARALERAAKEKKQKRRRIKRTGNCIAWGDPHWTTFDGRRYDWYSAGEYVLAYDQVGHGEQINTLIQKPRSNFPVAYNTGIAFKSGGNIVSLQYKNPRHSFNPFLYLNGKPIGIFSGARYVLGDLVVDVTWTKGQHWHGRQVLVIQSRKSHTTLKIRFHRHHAWGERMVYMDAHIQYDGYFDKRVSTGGMCGRYNGHAGDDFVMRNGQITHSVAAFVMSWRVSARRSLMVARPGMQQPSLADLRARRLSPLQLANGNRKLVSHATSACGRVAAAQRKNCIVDFIVGGGKSVAAEARKAASMANHH